jgi:hypothetical protein
VDGPGAAGGFPCGRSCDDFPAQGMGAPPHAR